MTADAITSTYRLQLRGDRFRLADAEALVPYLADLGISHLYLSPILTASEGSTHGYDVTDPTTVSEALGGRAALESLSATARSHGLGVVVDIVPNHLGVATPRENPFWWDVLRFGRASSHAHVFDIDWTAGRIALPVLGDDADVAELTVDRSGDETTLAYYDHRFPVDPSTDDGSDDARAVHDRQAYELVGWRSGRIGYRRFFSVSDLAGIRQEDPGVFDWSHEQVRSWFTDGLVDGVRVDHPDGLTDPADYLRRLRDLIGPESWLVVEKILTAAEPLDATLPVDGTTGYDALADIGDVLLDRRGEDALTRLAEETTGDAADAAWVHAAERALKRETARTQLAPEVRRLAAAVVRDTRTDARAESIAEAAVEVVARMPVYRSDYAPLTGLLPRLIGEVQAEQPDRTEALDALVAAVAVGGEAAARLQQVAGAVMAKSVEDCMFYRAARLVSLQEVGGDPARFGLSTPEFHARLAERARWWPRAMTTLSTHDTKRGEDVRARIGVLSQVPELWRRCLADWNDAAPSPDGSTGLFLWQNIIGTWPANGELTDTYRERLHAYAEKAMREAGSRTSWNDQDADFESAVHTWIDTLLDGPVAQSVTEFVAGIAPHGWSDSLAQKLVHLTGPGIPDVYQGTEVWEDSLVDPDNRRDVDYAALRTLAETTTSAPAVDGTGAAKFWVTRHAVTLRRERPASFVGGDYVPVTASGSASDHVVGFGRGEHGGAPNVVVLATRASLALVGNGRENDTWGDTTVALPEGEWTDRLTGATYSGTTPAATVFGTLPVALLVR
ncbi:malto-oligosyltrehalose synthase [Rhodococcoides corynebacterioides]|uniref:Malto-oligosyltrehalose synthase n=1 Tax=Rhodococcoides corynebacterioides TaxID=53972 RepID=A0ABS7P0R4_9NOCA|nr:malto-oligosyltrehalose synthase [Rhodococcus corynebacterioides]MBY6365986.1 malto-oligosyltrehalose synthase [Rhodococcus corynebacterioides]MBY6409084.1 malto-oligosyltrehalose synthase [Rhodococcus corynebacterioides]